MQTPVPLRAKVKNSYSCGSCDAEFTNPTTYYEHFIGHNGDLKIVLDRLPQIAKSAATQHEIINKPTNTPIRERNSVGNIQIMANINGQFEEILTNVSEKLTEDLQMKQPESNRFSPLPLEVLINENTKSLENNDIKPSLQSMGKEHPTIAVKQEPTDEKLLTITGDDGIESRLNKSINFKCLQSKRPKVPNVSFLRCMACKKIFTSKAELISHHKMNHVVKPPPLILTKSAAKSSEYTIVKNSLNRNLTTNNNCNNTQEHQNIKLKIVKSGGTSKTIFKPVTPNSSAKIKKIGETIIKSIPSVNNTTSNSRPVVARVHGGFVMTKPATEQMIPIRPSPNNSVNHNRRISSMIGIKNRFNNIAANNPQHLRNSNYLDTSNSSNNVQPKSSNAMTEPNINVTTSTSFSVANSLSRPVSLSKVHNVTLPPASKKIRTEKRIVMALRKCKICNELFYSCEAYRSHMRRVHFNTFNRDTTETSINSLTPTFNEANLGIPLFDSSNPEDIQHLKNLGVTKLLPLISLKNRSNSFCVPILDVNETSIANKLRVKRILELSELLDI